MKKALIITYYWPPAGGGGVQRWLKFAKFLPQHDWTPVIYTPANPDYPLTDEHLVAEIPKEAEIITKPIIEPYRVFRSLSGKKKDAVHAGFIAKNNKPSRLRKILGWTRGNLFIPDARMLWINPSIKHIINYLKENPVDVIISTGPPHSMHLIALGVHNKTNIPWIADFRDPWVNMDNLEQFNLGNRAMRKHEKLEKLVMDEADVVVSVSFTETENYRKITNTPVHTITNGFDAEDFSKRFPISKDKFILGHYGTLGIDRDAPGLWEALEMLCQNEDFKKDFLLEFIGPTDALILHNASEAISPEHIKYTNYTNHNLALESMQNATCLLLVLNDNGSEKGRIPGKIFEYMASGRSVLGIGAVDSDSAKLLRESEAGKMFERSDIPGIMDYILSKYLEWKSDATSNDNSESIAHYSRSALTSKLAQLLDELTQKVRTDA